MNIKKQEKLHICQILMDEKEGVTIQRLLNGRVEIVSRGGATFGEDGHDKVEAPEEDIRIYWQELQSKDYIVTKDNYNKDWFKLTTKGERYCNILKATLVEPLDIDLDSVVFDDHLKEEIRTLFEDGEYVKCISEATKFLEQELRNKTEAPSNKRGQELATFAFKSEIGKLVPPYCQDKGHEDGLHDLFLGAFKFIRNLSVHHSTDFNDQRDNLQMLLFVDFLVRILNKSQLRGLPSSNA